MSKPTVGCIVQLNPQKHIHHNGFWAGNFMLVTEVKSWGVQGYAKCPDGDAYYRAKNGTFEVVGHAVWVREEDADTTNTPERVRSPKRSTQ